MGGGVGGEGGRVGGGGYRDDRVDITGRGGKTIHNYMADNKSSFSCFKYKCCLALNLSPGAEFHAVGSEIDGNLFTISTRCGGI